MQKDKKIFNPIQYKKCQNLSQNIQKTDKTMKKCIPEVIYNMKSTQVLNEHYQQQKQRMKKQWLQIKNKTNLLDNLTINKQQYQQQISGRQRDIGLKNDDKNTRYLQQQNQNQQIMTLSDSNKINILSRTQPTNFISQSQLMSQQSQYSSLLNCPQLNMLNSTCHLQQFMSNSQRPQRNVYENQSSKKFINQSLDIQVSFSTQQKRRKTIYSQTKTLILQDQNNEDKLNFKQKNKNTPKLSKSLMAQKIINLRKTFNKNHIVTQSSPSKSQNIQKRVYYQINKQLAITSYQQKSIQSLNFPLLHNEESKKMSFNELFEYQKKKMQNLKKLLSQNNIEDSIDLQKIKITDKNTDLKNILKSKNSLKKLTNSQTDNKEVSLLSHSESKKSYLLYPIKGKTHSKNMSIEQHRKRISSHDPTNPQKIPMEIKINLSAVSNEKQLKPQSKRRKKQLISHVTTYNFDYIQKQKIQNPQIKQLRNKYLYTNKKKFNKEDLPPSIVANVSIQGQQSNTKKWRTKFSSDSFVQDFLQIQKIPPSIDRKILKTSLKQIQTKSDKRRFYRNVESQKEKCQNMELITFRQKFQPWQNKRHNYEILEDDICQFGK